MFESAMSYVLVKSSAFVLQCSHVLVKYSVMSYVLVKSSVCFTPKLNYCLFTFLTRLSSTLTSSSSHDIFSFFGSKIRSFFKTNSGPSLSIFGLSFTYTVLSEFAFFYVPGRQPMEFYICTGILNLKAQIS